MNRQELFIVCANRRCGAVKRVKSRYEQRRRRFCSRRCVGAACGGVQRLTLEQRRAQAMRSKATKQKRAMQRLEQMSKIQIWRTAYSIGWKAGARSARRRAAAQGSGR